MTGISVRESTYRNNRGLHISMDDRNSVYGHGFFSQDIYGKRASLIVELLKRHGKCEINWSGGLCVHCYISDQLLLIIRRMVNMKRNMTEKIQDELEAKLDDLDGFDVALAPYVISEKLKPFGGSNWATISG